MRKRDAGFSIVEIVVVVIVLGILGLVGWRFYDAQQSDNARGKTQPVAQETASQLQPDDITKKIKDDYVKTYKLLDVEKNNQPKAGELSYNLSETSPAYKTKGFTYYNNYNGGSSLSVVVGPVDWNAEDQLPRPVDTKARENIAATYRQFGLKKITTRGDKAQSNSVDEYLGKGVFCTVETPNSATSSTAASCGRVNEYKKAAAALQPFADALGDVDSSTALMGLKISDSAVSGYQKAYLGVYSIYGSGSTAAFYKEGDSTWKFFARSQQGHPCTAYATEALKNAFKGEECFTASGAVRVVE